MASTQILQVFQRDKRVFAGSETIRGVTEPTAWPAL
jgi:hypothetical protein